MERLTAAEAVTADSRRWPVTHSAHQPTSTLIAEVFSTDREDWVLTTSHGSGDCYASQLFWAANALVSRSQPLEIPPGLPAPDPVDSIKLRTTSHVGTWFASNER